MHLEFRKGAAWASKKGRRVAKELSSLDIKSIAVIRHAAIGDMYAIRPFLVECKRFFPNAKITLSLIKSYSYGAPLDLVDEVHIINNISKKLTFMDRKKEAELIGEHDFLFDLTDSALSAALTFFSKAKLKVGYPYRLHKRAIYDICVPRSDYVFETENVIHMLNIFGAKHSTPFFDYGMPKIKSQEKRVIYFPGASVSSKCWPSENFSKLIEKMAELFDGYEHVLLGGVREDEDFSFMIQGISRENVCYRKSMPLEETERLLRSASLVVSNDTGIRNMAIALDAPTVGIFFSTNPYRYWPRNGMHEIVFNEDYAIPSVEDVFLASQSLLVKTKERA